MQCTLCLLNDLSCRTLQAPLLMFSQQALVARHMTAILSLQIEDSMVKASTQRRASQPGATPSRDEAEGVSKHQPPSQGVRRNCPWTEAEHLLFLLGLEEHGRGAWRAIASDFVGTRTATQVRLGTHHVRPRRPPDNALPDSLVACAIGTWCAYVLSRDGGVVPVLPWPCHHAYSFAARRLSRVGWFSIKRWFVTCFACLLVLRVQLMVASGIGRIPVSAVAGACHAGFRPTASQMWITTMYVHNLVLRRVCILCIWQPLAGFFLAALHRAQVGL